MKKRVLITQPSGIGDLIQIYPLLELMGKDKNYQIDLLIKNQQLIPIFENSGFFNEIIPFYNIKTISLFKPSVIKQWMSLRKKYDIAVSLFPGRGIYGSLLKLMIASKTRVAHKYHFKFFKNISLFLTSSVVLERKHLLDINFDIFKEAGLVDLASVSDIKRDINWQTPEEFKELAKGFLTQLGYTENLVGLYPGGNAEFKRWDYTKWNEFIAKTAAKYPEKQFLLFLGPDEKSIFHLFEIYDDVKNIHIIKDQSFEMILGIMSYLEMFIGNDGGLTHTFSLFNTPQVTIFGATDHEYASPMNSKNVNVLPERADFEPVWIPYDGFLLPESVNMINEITVEQVCEIFDEKMSKL